MAEVEVEQKTNDKNRLLREFGPNVPYIKELKCLTGVNSTNACILMQQLEYWFHKKPNGFYKFLAPPTSTQYAYKDNDSWTEELHFSEHEFRTAFDQIGIRYKSKKEFDNAKRNGDVFKGRYYCCYFDKVSRLTHYFRNHRIVENAIDYLTKCEFHMSANGNSELQKSSSFLPRNSEYSVLEGENVSLESTETTTNNTHNTIKREGGTLSLIESNPEPKEELNTDVIETENTPLYVSSISNESSAEKPPRILVPEDFEPTLDEQFRAAMACPEKSSSHVTAKFVHHYRNKGVKKTMAEWRLKWWEWMMNERPACDSHAVDNEVNEIINEVLEIIHDEVIELDVYTYTIETIAERLWGRLTWEAIELVFEYLVGRGIFTQLEDVYYLKYKYEENEDWRNEVDRELQNAGLMPTDDSQRPDIPF